MKRKGKAEGEFSGAVDPIRMMHITYALRIPTYALRVRGTITEFRHEVIYENLPTSVPRVM